MAVEADFFDSSFVWSTIVDFAALGSILDEPILTTDPLTLAPAYEPVFEVTGVNFGVWLEPGAGEVGTLSVLAAFLVSS